MKRTALCLLPLLLLWNCTEKYNAVIDKKMNALVVEGRITNLKESCFIKLSLATSYDSAINYSGILGGKVFVTDNLGGMYRFHEKSLGFMNGNPIGYYYSDPSEFVAMVGKAYTLHIEMDNGDIYESSVQKFTPPITIDSIHGIITDHDYYYNDILGNMTTTYIKGAETFADLSFSSDSIFQFRFENTLIQCYSFWLRYTLSMKMAGKPWPQNSINCDVSPCPYVVYFWQKNNLESNLSAPTNIFASKKLRNNTVCFFPMEYDYKSKVEKIDSCGYVPNGDVVCSKILDKSGFEGKIFQTRIYALNYESSLYYSGIQKQLSSGGKLFDPVAVQLTGNIKCVNHPEKLAFGLFDVSSCIIRTYWLYFSETTGSIMYKPIRDISDIPDHGMAQDMPDYWSITYP